MRHLPRVLCCFLLVCQLTLLLFADISRADSLTTGDLDFDCKKCLKPTGSFVYDNTFDRFTDVTVNWDHMQFSFFFIAFSSEQFLYNELLNGELLFYFTTDPRESSDGQASAFLFSSDTEMLFRTDSPDPAIDVTFEGPVRVTPQRSCIYSRASRFMVAVPCGAWDVLLAAKGGSP